MAVRRVQLGNQARDEVLVLQRFLNRRQAWAMPLSLGRVRAVPVRGVAVAGLLILQLSLQTLQVKVAQGIGAEAASLEVAVGGDIRVLLQQVRDAGEDGWLDAIGMQALEQQERLEVGVGREASSHPPGVCSARAMGLGRDGSHGGERGVERATRVMGASGGDSVADGRVAWFDEEIVANCRRGASQPSQPRGPLQRPPMAAPGARQSGASSLGVLNASAGPRLRDYVASGTWT